MNDPLGRLSPQERDAVRERGQPDWIEPMLAAPGHEPFSDPRWLYERKLDGARLLTHRRRGRPRLLTRNRKARSATYPELEEALSGSGRAAERYYLFGILHVDGHDLRRVTS